MYFCLLIPIFLFDTMVKNHLLTSFSTNLKNFHPLCFEKVLLELCRVKLRMNGKKIMLSTLEPYLSAYSVDKSSSQVFTTNYINPSQMPSPIYRSLK